MISKKVDNVSAALKGLEDGMTLMLGGFGLCGIPENIIGEMVEFCPNREIFVAIDLNHPKELLLRGKPSLLQKKLDGLKAEFILVIS